MLEFFYKPSQHTAAVMSPRAEMQDPKKLKQNQIEEFGIDLQYEKLNSHNKEWKTRGLSHKTKK